MADQGRWYKLWCSCASDPSLDNLPIADFGRWAKLGAIIKEQGTDGVLIISEPSRLLCAALQVASFSELISCITTFPNVTVTSVTNANVTSKIEYHNWWKYQGDFSGDRVKRHRDKIRESVTAKKRREEKRGEETKKEEKNLAGAPPLPLEEKPNGKDHQIKLLLTYYDETYTRLHRGQRPVITGEDAKAAQSILKNRTIEVSKRMVKSYLEDPPTFYKEKALLGMRHILSAANTLLARREVAG